MVTASRDAAVHSALLDRLHDARRVTDSLFEIVRPDALYERPIGERHRIIFYIGHLEAFDWNLLFERILDVKTFDPELDRLFAFGIDPVDGGLPTDQAADWPSVERVREYVQRTRRTIDEGIDRLDASLQREFAFPPSQLLNVAVEHRLMHAETLAYMFHQLPFDKKLAPYGHDAVPSSIVRAEMCRIPAGRATLGLARSSGAFGWDNEFEECSVDLPALDVDRYMVTNGEFLDFIAAGGYKEPSIWKESDWKWRTERKIEHPVFWKRVEGGWSYRTMFQEVPLPLDWPVYVSHAEASAFAKWARKRLLSEAEWHRAAYGDLDGTERSYPWGESGPKAEHGNFDSRRWDPTPVGSFARGESAFGVSDLLGNGWEWTSTLFAPLPGFTAFAFYPGYSANFFDGKHYVLKGGSARTAASMLRRSFRNWFQPHYQYVYAGFRCGREV
jgi:gamma-glutamyl hercynylcysteine S-oxide synthase